MKAYAGIGSRQTPEAILHVIRQLAYELSGRGWTLRSGAAPGADSSFEDGAFEAYFANGRRPRPELYLPWPRFENRRKALVTREEPQPEAFEIAREHHPNWANLMPGVQKLHARNVHQILGPDVTNPLLSRFVLCWTAEAKGGGGTGQALRIARVHDIPVFDLAHRVDYERVVSGLFE